MSDFFTQMASRALLLRSEERSLAFTLPEQKGGPFASPVLPRPVVIPFLATGPVLAGKLGDVLQEQTDSSGNESEQRLVAPLVERSLSFDQREKTWNESEQEDRVPKTMQPASPLQPESLTIATQQAADQKKLPQSDRLSIVPRPVFDTVFSPTIYLQQYQGMRPEVDRTEWPQQLVKSANVQRLESVSSPSMHMEKHRGVPLKEGSRQDFTRETASATMAPVIKVSIGRVEVRAVVTPTPMTPRQVAQPTPRSALQEYLEERKQGKL